MAPRGTIDLTSGPNGNGNGTNSDQSGDKQSAGANAGGILDGVIDPATVAAGAAAGAGADPGSTTGKRGRGRPPGSKNSKGSTARTPLDLSITDTLLFTVHMMLAERSGIKQLALTEEESKLLAVKIAQVQSVFHVDVSPRTKAIVELGLVSATIYGPRVASYVIEQRSKPKTSATIHAVK